MDTTLIESLTGTFRDECLNAKWFLSIEDARKKIENWRRDYSKDRPRNLLWDLTLRQFVDKYINHLRGRKTPFLTIHFPGEALLHHKKST